MVEDHRDVVEDEVRANEMPMPLVRPLALHPLSSAKPSFHFVIYEMGTLDLINALSDLPYL